GEKGLFADAVLRNGHGLCGGTDDGVLREELQAFRRHVLELGGGGRALRRHAAQRLAVEVVGAQVLVRHAAGGAVVAGVEHHHAVAHALGRHGEHAAELATAQQAEQGAGRDHFLRTGSFIALTLAVCLRRKAASLPASFGWSAASMATANNPALAAPASPTAKVATGMPRGICTMDSSESRP